MPNGNGNGELKFTRGEWIRLAGLIFAITVFVVGGTVSLASWYGGTNVRLDNINEKVCDVEEKVDALAIDVNTMGARFDKHLAAAKAEE
jgi:outer membrane murein-binding lipoprotein Lpp